MGEAMTACIICGWTPNVAGCERLVAEAWARHRASGCEKLVARRAKRQARSDAAKIEEMVGGKIEPWQSEVLRTVLARVVYRDLMGRRVRLKGQAVDGVSEARYKALVAFCAERLAASPDSVVSHG